MSRFPDVGDVFGGYRITAVLGRGGMGVVFRAEHVVRGREVALKLLAPQLAADSGFRDRFLREVAALSRQDSPHVVTVLDQGEEDGCLFLVTQLVADGDLRSRLDEEGPLPPWRALNIVAQVASALIDAHSLGVMHRDIKPGNVLVRRGNDGEDFAYLCDFGIARADGEESTLTGGVLGTLAYMAPERHQGARATPRSDIYALGCLLWAALTGRPPYAGNDVEIALAHLKAPRPMLPGGDEVSRAVNAVLARSMAREPDERYETAAHMRRDLVRARDLAAVQKEADPARTPRRRARVVGSVLGVLALVGATAAVLALAPDRSPTGAADSNEPRESPVADRVTCWDGEVTRDPAACSRPRGVRGLRWAFPAFDAGFDRCREVKDPEVERKTLVFYCPFSNNREEGARYSEWISARAARTVSRRDYRPYTSSVVPVGNGARLLMWRRLSQNEWGRFTVNVTYPTWPLSMDVDSASLAGVDAGCAAVSLRHPTTFDTVDDVCSLVE